MHDELGLYVLGAHPDPRAFEEHLRDCEECRAELETLRAALDTTDEAIADVEPPADLRERVLTAARGGGRVVPLRPRRAPPARLLSALAVAALAVVVAGIGLRGTLFDTFDPDRVFALASPTGPGTATARVDDTGSGSIVELEVKGLPDAPRGFSFECWFVGEGDTLDKPNRVSAGRFKSGDGKFRMQSAADPDRFPNMGVTLEPDDGNPARTGDKVLVTKSVRED